MDAPTPEGPSLMDAGPTETTLQQVRSGRVGRRGPGVHRPARAIAEYLARAPGTHILLLVIAVTTLVLRGVDASTATRILRHQSTNLVQMSHDAPRVLLLSAFLTDQGRLAREVIEFTLILVPLERWLGTYRWLCVFIAGHVGATLATTIGIWLQARGGSAGRDILTPVDVGISYGLVAAAAVLTYRFRRPVSLTLVVLLLVDYGAGVVLHGSFTDWGHLCALAIGFAIGPLARRDVTPVAAVTADGGARSSRWWARLVHAWRWVVAPPEPLHHRMQRRAATAIALVLLLTGSAIIVLLGAGHGAAVTIPAAGEQVEATVLGRPLGCGRSCTTTVVRYTPIGAAAGVSTDAVLGTPAHTLLRPGDRLIVRVDPRAATHVLLVQPPRRVHADGLLGAVAIAAVVGGLAMLAAARRMSGARAGETAMSRAGVRR